MSIASRLCKVGKCARSCFKEEITLIPNLRSPLKGHIAPYAPFIVRGSIVNYNFLTQFLLHSKFSVGKAGSFQNFEVLCGCFEWGNLKIFGGTCSRGCRIPTLQLSFSYVHSSATETLFFCFSPTGMVSFCKWPIQLLLLLLTLL